MRRLLVMMLMALSVTAVAPALTASPAFAAEARCSTGEPWPLPWWWGNVNARIRTGATKVLSVPSGSDVLLQTYRSVNSQKWVHDCIGYDSVTGLNIWKLRYAADTSRCLDIASPGIASLNVCNSYTSQSWEKVPIGSYTALRSVGFSGECLQPIGAGTADGTLVVVESCHYGDSQLWW